MRHLYWYVIGNSAYAYGLAMAFLLRCVLGPIRRWYAAQAERDGGR